jgi:uncharacterized membrane protein YgcG
MAHRKKATVSVRNALWLAVLLIGVCPLLRADCNDVVWDQQNLFSGTDSQMLRQAAQQLTNAGADVHVLTVHALFQNTPLEADLLELQHHCPSWQVNGQRKNNLLLFAVDAQHHKSGIFYGALYHRALDSTWHDIATQYMNPHFGDHEWAAGLAEGMRQTRVLLAETPGTGKTVVQHFEPATDYVPFWHILGWIVFGLFATLAVWFSVKFFRSRATRKQKFSDAQADLQQAKNDATNDLDKAKQKLAEDAATGMVIASRQSVLDRGYMTFSRIAAVEDRNNSIAYITSMAKQYRAISESVQQCMDSTPPMPVRRVPRYSTTIPSRPRRMQAEPNVASTPAPPAPASNTTVIHESSDSGFTTGLILADMLGSRNEERESRRRDDDDDRPAARFSRDDSPALGDGGGDTNFGDDDPGGGGDADVSRDDSGGGGSTNF